MQPQLTFTADHSDRFHIFGCDAVVRANGNALLVEFNDWHVFSPLCADTRSRSPRLADAGLPL